jgi:exopolyphosphatase/guanosine-5'-triphosphate,3'-diphosphate pyrophosphatase
MTNLHTPKTIANKTSPRGLQHWVKKVPKECDSVEAGWKADAVHDLRVALRRCRSLADGMRQVDSDRNWRRLKRGCRDLFVSLGSLRDAQVLIGWVRKLSRRGDPVREGLLALLAARTQQHRQEAREALRQFDRKEWSRMGNELAQRARRIPLNGMVAQHLALERWEEAKAQDHRAQRARSAIAWHRTRIALKRFRYTAENSLPRRYAEWESNLKRVQDLLGEVHDLDALRLVMRRVRQEAPGEDWLRWQERIHLERQRRLNEYRGLTGGDDSLFNTWRGGLPRGGRQEAAAIARFSAWAGYLDPAPVHARHVAALAMELFDQMAAAGVDAVFRETRARGILQVAALLQDVGRAKKDKGHHKASFRLIRAIKPPIGWSAQDIREIALVARYHRGAEPNDRQASFASLAPAQQQRVVWLAALLRLANGLAGQRDGRISGVQLQATPEAILVQVRGYVNDLFSASHLAEQKHLLEAVAGRPVVVRGEAAQTAPPLQSAGPAAARVLQMRSFVA